MSGAVLLEQLRDKGLLGTLIGLFLFIFFMGFFIFCIAPSASLPLPSSHTPQPTLNTSLFENKAILFMGDSILRNVYHQFVGLANETLRFPTIKVTGNLTMKHSHFSHNFPKHKLQLQFLWTEHLANLSNSLDTLRCDGIVQGGKPKKPQKWSAVIMGVGLWDLLWEEKAQQFAGLQRLQQSIAELIGSCAESASSPRLLLWRSTTPTETFKMTDERKQRLLTPENVARYNDLAQRMIGILTEKRDGIFSLDTPRHAVDLQLYDVSKVLSLSQDGQNTIDGVHLLQSLVEKDARNTAVILQNYFSTDKNITLKQVGLFKPKILLFGLYLLTISLS